MLNGRRCPERESQAENSRPVAVTTFEMEKRVRNSDLSEEERKQAADGIREKPNELFSPDILSQPIHIPRPVTPDDDDEARHPEPKHG